MTQSMDLNKMGLIPMTEDELFSTDGGKWWQWVLSAVAVVVGTAVAMATGTFWVGACIAVGGGFSLGLWAFLD
jgi:lactobin A/cerein 7B family class IIb bacteriocin